MADDKPRRRSIFKPLQKLISKPTSIPRSSSTSSSNANHPAADSSTNSDDADLSPKAKDTLFACQLALPDPRRLGPDAFVHAGITDSPSISSRIHSALCAASILSSHDSDYKVYTNRITRKLPNQIPWVSVQAQRLLVGLLFFWEEELVRWQLIETQMEAERAGFEAVGERVRREGLGDSGGNVVVPTDSPPAFRSQPPTPAMFATDQSQSQGQSNGQSRIPQTPRTTAILESRLQGLWEQHRLALARLESSRKQLPSKRDEAGNRIGMSPGFTGRPPAYGDVLSTVGVLGSPSRDASPRWEVRTMGGGNGTASGSHGGIERRGTGETLGGLGEPALPLPGAEKGGSCSGQGG